MLSVTRLIKGVCIAAFIALVVCSLPQTVQSLDTGELVAGSYNLTVVHPPGYPTYVWLQHIATHALGGTVFWRAALTNALFAAALLASLSFATEISIAAFFALVLPLAMHGLFWQYTLLPDVFMLHNLFYVLLATLYLYATPNASRTWSLAIFWGVGLANHQTLIFAAPFVMHGLWEDASRRRTFKAFCAAVVVCLGLYASLFMMHPQAPASWGNLQSTSDWLRHVLRAEYGTFRLARSTSSGAGLGHLVNFVQRVGTTLPVTCILGGLVPLAVALHRQHRALLPKRFWILWGSVMTSTVLFFAGANLDAGAVLERFYLAPLVSLTVLALYVSRALTLQRHARVGAAVAAGALLLCASQVALDWPARNLSQDTVVEDYALNLLRMTAETPNAVILAEGDTPLNALRYVQQVQDVQPQTLVLSTAGVPAWRLATLRRQAPALHFPAAGAPGLSQASLMREFVAPNQPTFNFFANALHGLDTTGQRVTWMGLGKFLHSGTGEDVDATSIDRVILRSTPEHLPPSDTVLEEKVLFAGYAQADLAAANMSHDIAVKRAHYTHALATVPYCWPAALRLCLLSETPESECRALSSRLRAQDAAYF